MSPRDFEPGPLAAVDLHADGDRFTLTFIKDFAHPREKVWAALTDPAQLQQWSPFDADRDLASTGPATLTMVNGADREALTSSVTRAEPPALLEYTWGDAVLEWRLDAIASGTRLTLRHTGPGREWSASAAAGWHICLVVAETELDGEPIGRIVGQDAMQHGWQQLHDQYATKLDVSEAAR